MNSLRQTALASQQDALQQYLDSLLQEIPYQENGPIDVPQPIAVDPLEVPEPLTAMERRPTWATVPFQVLLFKVARLQLAVPLVQLSAVVQGGGVLKRVPEMKPYLQGLLRYQEKNVQIIEAAFLTGRVEPAERQTDDSSQHYLLFSEGHYGFSCTALREVVLFDPEAIRWRRGAARQAWFAGIHSTEMCALLDLTVLGAKLMEC